MGYAERKASTEGGEKKESNLVRVSGLWKLKSGKGLSGNIDDKGLDAIADAIQKAGGKARLLVLVNKFADKGEPGKNPGFVMFVSGERQAAPGAEVKRPNGEAAKATEGEFAGIF